MENISKVGILSDSHDNMPKIRAAVELFNRNKVDFVIHAGDLVAPFTAREIKKLACPYNIVLGNNDGEILGLYKTFEGNVFQPPFRIKINDKKVIVLHDAMILDNLENLKNYDLIIYGHDHHARIEKLEDRTLIVNPGECGGWLTGKCSVAIWDVLANSAEIIEL